MQCTRNIATNQPTSVSCLDVVLSHTIPWLAKHCHYSYFTICYFRGNDQALLLWSSDCILNHQPQIGPRKPSLLEDVWCKENVSFQARFQRLENIKEFSNVPLFRQKQPLIVHAFPGGSGVVDNHKEEASIPHGLLPVGIDAYLRRGKLKQQHEMEIQRRGLRRFKSLSKCFMNFDDGHVVQTYTSS
jgi:hypothetical protein